MDMRSRKGKEKRSKSNKSYGGWNFLLIVILIYVIISLVRYEFFLPIMAFFLKILLKILPVFLIVYLLMVGIDYFVSPQFTQRHFTKKGIKAWFFMVIGGILSSGPIYMWYPLLAELKKKGMSHGLLACFLYNRAIKIPLLSIAIYYFGIKYVGILSFVMIGFSIIQGLIIDYLMGDGI